MKHLEAVKIILLLFLTRSEAVDQCYNVRGTALDSTYAPCNLAASVSACCQLNHASPDVCLGAGLCLSTRDEYAGTIWGDGCTDQDGNNSECPQICAGVLGATDFWNVMQCPEQGKWCCRVWTDWDNCCNDTAKLVTLTSTDATPSVLPSNTNATVISNGTVSAPLTEASSASETGISATVVGGAVGGALGGALVASVITVILLWRQNRKLKSMAHTSGGTVVTAHSPEPYGGMAKNRTPTSSYQQPPVAEVDGNPTGSASELYAPRY
ncbi:hypothetical protein LTR70_003212 [Exophiala xenobiotica]|uniref:Mid2 domain-containing protein n=1 Tax=Lithohypha guttulata TaxID=1690604 RepID=A0ABR0KGM6_9EURO|nr:hypothetical protein LTR24_002857 [Lithohypha guttulata]KAK5323724.1 hypothetical protein LTR70_003212 [Exophiala xenobiotica]